MYDFVDLSSWKYGTGCGPCGITQSKLIEALILLGGKYKNDKGKQSVKIDISGLVVKKDKYGLILNLKDKTVVVYYI